MGVDRIGPLNERVGVWQWHIDEWRPVPRRAATEVYLTDDGDVNHSRRLLSVRLLEIATSARPGMSVFFSPTLDLSAEFLPFLLPQPPNPLLIEDGHVLMGLLRMTNTC